MAFVTALGTTEFRVERCVTVAMNRTGGEMNMVSELVNMVCWDYGMDVNLGQGTSATWLVVGKTDRPQHKLSNEQKRILLN